MLAKSAGVSQLIVIVNKMDHDTVKWSKARFDEIKYKLGAFLGMACKYSPDNIHWIPVSGLLGTNIKEKVDKSICDWYQGESLLTLLDILPVPGRDHNGPLRIPIFEKVREQEDCLVLGKIESGMIHPGNSPMTSLFMLF